MNRTDFDNVYLNANCIAELGFVRAIVALADAPASPPAGAAASAPTPAEDEAALDGVLGFGSLTPDQLAQQVARLQAASLADDTGQLPFDAAGQTFGDAIGIGALDPEWGAPDVGLYLEQAQSSREALQARIDAAFARADLPALESTLSALPGSLPPLSGVLDADALEAWLVRYDAQDAALATLVAQVRALDPVY